MAKTGGSNPKPDLSELHFRLEVVLEVHLGLRRLKGV